MNKFFTTKRMAYDAMMAALVAVLGYFSISFGNFKITFESVPIWMGALLFGPADGALIGGIGTLINQILRYGITATTALWVLPYVVCGLVVGWYSKRKNFSPSRVQIIVIVVISGILITILNLFGLYVDSHIYGYYSPSFIFGNLVFKLVFSVVKSAVFGTLLPAVVNPLKRVVKD